MHKKKLLQEYDYYKEVINCDNHVIMQCSNYRNNYNYVLLHNIIIIIIKLS